MPAKRRETLSRRQVHCKNKSRKKHKTCKLCPKYKNVWKEMNLHWYNFPFTYGPYTYVKLQAWRQKKAICGRSRSLEKNCCGNLFCTFTYAPLGPHTLTTNRWPLKSLLNTGNVLKLESQWGKCVHVYHVLTPQVVYALISKEVFSCCLALENNHWETNTEWTIKLEQIESIILMIFSQTLWCFLVLFVRSAENSVIVTFIARE